MGLVEFGRGIEPDPLVDGVESALHRSRCYVTTKKEAECNNTEEQVFLYCEASTRYLPVPLLIRQKRCDTLSDLASVKNIWKTDRTRFSAGFSIYHMYASRHNFCI